MPVLQRRRRICISPVTVSQQIKALEDECSVTLFDRSGRLVRLTNAGQVILTHVERILAQSRMPALR